MATGNGNQSHSTSEANGEQSAMEPQKKPSTVIFAELNIVMTHIKYMAYANLTDRIQSFATWTKDDINIKPEYFASAGFFYAGKEDQVRCFRCGGGLKKWEPCDDPWVQHATWYPTCAHLRINKGNDFIKAVTELSKTDEHISCEKVETYMQDQKMKADGLHTAKPLMYDPAVQVVSELGYKTEEVIKIAEELKRTSPTMTSAELYTAVVEAKVPKVDSASQSQSETVLLEDQGATGGVDKTDGKEENFESLMIDNEKLREMYTCKVCLVNQVGVVFLPCGHLLACPTCASALENCAICREPITAMVKVQIY